MAPIRARVPLGRAAPQGGLNAGEGVAPGAPSERSVAVRTHLLTPRDDLTEVVRRYALPLCGPDSVVAISESAVAIVQRRYLNPDDVRPCLAARVLARFVERTGSLSSPYALQAVMNEEGVWRVCGAFAAGALSHLLLRRKGDFYRLAGAQAALVDDVTGTLPPFDKYIVMGPARPREVVDGIGRALGVEVAIVDVNDLAGVAVLAATSRVDIPALVEALRPNPAGNEDEQTPIVVVRAAAKR